MANRNYRKEYDNYHGKPKQKKRRAARGRAATKKTCRVGLGEEVAHIDNNPTNNKSSNLKCQKKSTNRSFKRDKNARRA